jgi:hypothetical protein
LLCNQRVGSSSLSTGTIGNKDLAASRLLVMAFEKKIRAKSFYGRAQPDSL